MKQQIEQGLDNHYQEQSFSYLPARQASESETYWLLVTRFGNKGQNDRLH